MSSQIDTKIDAMLKQLQQQRDDVENSKTSRDRAWATRGALQIARDDVINLQTATIEQCVRAMKYVLADAQLHEAALAKLGLSSKDYPHQILKSDATDWINDIEKRVSVITYQDRLKKLNEMEAAATKLLSADRQRELEAENLLRQFAEMNPSA